MNITTIKYDLLQIRKDPMLLLSIAVPFLIWAVMQFGFPALQNLISVEFSFDIVPYYEQAGIFLLSVIPMMFGMVYGFMLLDERDAGIISAISVTPLGRIGYLRLRLGIPMIFSFIASVLFCRLLGLGSQLNFFQLLFLCSILTLNAPILVLFLGAFADNKVEGMAIAKGFGVLLSAMLIDFVVPAPWNWLGIYSPLFWFERAFLSQNISDFVTYTFISLLTHFLLLYFLNKKFSDKID